MSSPAGFRDVFAVGEFRALWTSMVVSAGGDMLARVALSVLVFTRTRSPGLTGFALALTFLPHLVGGPLLSGLADRFPRRTIMLTCVIVRAVVIAVVAIPALPIPLILAAVALAELAAPPFSSALSALMPEVFDDEPAYVTASGIFNASFEVAQVIGFGVGGGLVALLGVHVAFAVDAATFAVAAVLIAAFIRRRPATMGNTDRPNLWGQLAAGVQVVFGDAWLRRLVLLAWLAAFLIAPEALAAPVAAGYGAGPLAVGLLLAAMPIGTAVAALVVVRVVAPDRRGAIVGPLALVSGLPLLACLAHPPLVLVWILWTATGALTSYSLLANTCFAVGVPAAHRGQAFGLAQAGLIAVQGIGLWVSGLVADHLSSLTVVGLAGGITIAAAALILLVPARQPAIAAADPA